MARTTSTPTTTTKKSPICPASRKIFPAAPGTSPPTRVSSSASAPASTKSANLNPVEPPDAPILSIRHSERSLRSEESLFDCCAILQANILVIPCEARSEEHTSELQSHVNLVC